MSITRDQLWNTKGDLRQQLYHSGKNYVASIMGGKNGEYDDYYYWIDKVSPEDKYEDTILDLATCMIIFMSKDKDPLHICYGDFTCSLIHLSGHKYLFITKRDTPYVFPEEIICKKYHIDPTPENQENVRALIERRVYSYTHRDYDKQKRCITFEDAEKLEDYLLNINLSLFSEDTELQRLHYLTGKKVSDLSSDEKMEASNYIASAKRPILLYKSPGNNKLLVNEIPDFQTVSYNELCDVLIANTEECSYCTCKMTILNTEYSPNGLSFDAIIPLYGHKKENIILCCRMCNSKKGNKNKVDI